MCMCTCVCVCVCVCVHACTQLFLTLYNLMDCSQASLSTGFPKQTSGVASHFLLWDLSDSGIKPEPLVSPALAGGFFTMGINDLFTRGVL